MQRKMFDILKKDYDWSKTKRRPKVVLLSSDRTQKIANDEKI